jgi:hypothetical protein
MVDAIRDQWALVLAVVVLIGVLTRLWWTHASHGR